MASKKRFSVYALIVDGVIRYIGQSYDPKSRFTQHQWESKLGKTLLSRKLRKAISLGIKIDFQIIASCLSKDEANELETRQIRVYGGHETKPRQLWNTHVGGQGGCSPQAAAAVRKKWATDAEFRARQSALARETLKKHRHKFKTKRIGAKRVAAVINIARARLYIDREKQRAAVSAASKKLWADPEYRARKTEQSRQSALRQAAERRARLA